MLKCFFFNNEREKVINKNYINLFYKKKVNTKIVINSNYNKNIFNNINSHDIFIITFDKNKIHYIPNKIPRFPILYNNYFIFNEFNLKEINGLCESKNLNLLISDLIYRIKKNFGVIISNQNINKGIKILNFFIDSNLNCSPSQGYKKYYKNKIEKLNIVTNCYTNKDYLPTNNHGWFTPKNKIILNYLLKTFNIKNIAELGSWYGKSTLFIAENTKANIYSFDKFQNTFISNYISDGSDILDNFYFNYLRFETFISNLRNYKNVFCVKYDCFIAPELLLMNDMKIDLFYIDFLKKKDKLIKFIKKLKNIYPNAIIMGDDYVISSVQKAIYELKKLYKIYTFKSCYVIFPFKIDKLHFFNFIENHDLNKKARIIDNNIKNFTNNKLYLYDTAMKIMKYLNFNKFLEYVKLYKLDLNLNIDIGSNDTLYIQFYIMYKNHSNFEKYEKIISKYQKPNNNKNQLNLNAYDYKNNDIELS